MKKLITICVVLVLFSTGYAGAGTWTTLDYPGFGGTEAWGIDGSNIVGHYWDSSHPKGFLYNITSGTWTTLERASACDTLAYGIDGSNIVGSSHYFSTDSSFGFIYKDSSFTNYFFPGPLTLNTYLRGIDGNNMVGSYDDQWGYYGFLHTASDWITLAMSGATETYPCGISGSNIVGYYSDMNYYSHGFLYNITSGTWTTLDMSGAIYTKPYGIDGSNIVGCYSDGSGTHGFVCPVPEPTTLFLLGLGAVILRKRKK